MVLTLDTASLITNMDKRRSLGLEPTMWAVPFSTQWLEPTILAVPFSTQWFPSLGAWYVSCFFFLISCVQSNFSIMTGKKFMVCHFGNTHVFPLLPGLKGFPFAGLLMGDWESIEWVVQNKSIVSQKKYMGAIKRMIPLIKMEDGLLGPEQAKA